MNNKTIDYLPMTKAECDKLGWKELDIIIVSGDAYVDHHSFGTALIGRYLTAHGFKVGIIAQPDLKNENQSNCFSDLEALGKPRLFFGVTAGNMDSLINHYTAQRKLRTNDSYSPAGKAGLRPDRATIIYTQALQRLFKDTPIVIGGIEASLRRIPHYDFWQDKVRNSILFDSKASLLVYGMAEKTILNVARQLDMGKNIKELTEIKGTVSAVAEKDADWIELPGAEEIADKDNFLVMNNLFTEHFSKRVICQKFGKRYLKHNPPAQPLTTAEIDFIYNLPFSKKPHPIYKDKTIPAYEQIKWSITSHRGCFGGCNFCTLYIHQGKVIQSRSKRSIISEVKKLAAADFFTGTITDIGGPSANMYGMSCSVTDCLRKSCLLPSICPNLQPNHREYLDMLQKCRQIAGINHLFVSSGIRTDLACKSEEFIEELVKNYTGGRIKVAPEHNHPAVLKAMNKQDFATYESFRRSFIRHCYQQNKRLSIVPYFMVGHPGTTLEAAIELAVYLKNNDIHPEQIQEFTPTPMSVSTTMYYTGKDPSTGKKIAVPKGRDIRLQKAMLQWFIPENRKYVIEALKKGGRGDLLEFFLGSV